MKQEKERKPQEQEILLNKVMQIITSNSSYNEKSETLNQLKHEFNEQSWEYVGDQIPNWLEKQNSELTENVFDIITIRDFRVRIYHFAGENALPKKLLNQFYLANVYSDQSGLERKFMLYRELVEVSLPLVKTRSENDVMHYIYTRSLNRLADLTQYWCYEEVAEELWLNLAEYALESEEQEKLATLEIIAHNAPWFAEKKPELFTALQN